MLNDGSLHKIFVVDDDLTLGESIASILKLKGYDVQTFNTGRDAIDKAKEEKPDLALLDYLLPGENAFEIIKDFQNIPGKELPIILMSASAQAAQVSEKLPINAFIAKPFQLDLLLETIEKHIN